MYRNDMPYAKAGAPEYPLGSGQFEAPLSPAEIAALRALLADYAAAVQQWEAF